MTKETTFCKANCSECPDKENCRGCIKTNGRPFGGRCVAAEYVKFGGIDSYKKFKEKLKDEINTLLTSLDIPKTDNLYELAGKYINLEYTIPNGEKVKFLSDKNIYLGTQIEFTNMGICYGVAADTNFILICSYSVDGSEAELIMYKKR